jgi:hypothetical protein
VPLPCWKHLSSEQYRHPIESRVQNIENTASAQQERSGKAPHLPFPGKSPDAVLLARFWYPGRMSPVPARRPLPCLTDRLPLGRSGLQVSPVCLGMVPRPETVPAAFDAGINFFFLSADLHWPRYEGMRRGLETLLARGGGVRDEIVVGVVSYLEQPLFQTFQVQEVIDAVAGPPPRSPKAPCSPKKRSTCSGSLPWPSRAGCSGARSPSRLQSEGSLGPLTNPKSIYTL